MPSDQQTLKSTIKGICSRSKLKPEYFLTLDSALIDPIMDESSWLSLFDGQGAKSAVQEKIYNSQMVRLLTLQALILPPTLPEFLIWMRSHKQDNHWTISFQFQQEIWRETDGLQQLKNFKKKVLIGVRSLIPRAIENPDLVPLIAWLLTEKQSIWGYCYQQKVRRDIDADLSLMKAYLRDRQSVDFRLAKCDRWRTIFSEISSCWQTNAFPLKKYHPLADLFAKLKDLKIAALFYQISSDAVPREILLKLQQHKYQDEQILFQMQLAQLEYKAYGMQLKQDSVFLGFLKSFLHFLIQLGGIIMPLPIAFSLMFVMLLSGFFTGVHVTKAQQRDKNYSINIQNSNLDLTPKSNQFSPENSEQFRKTYEALQTIINDLYYASQSKYNRNEIQQTIKNVLGYPFLPSLSPDLKYKSSDTTKQWVDAIKNYQQKQAMKNPDGVMNVGKKTSKTLKCEVALQLNIPLINGYSLCQPSIPQG